MKRVRIIKRMAVFVVALLMCSLAAYAADDTVFKVSPEGVIKHATTGLEWVIGPEKDFAYNEAEVWVKGCKIAGGGWRMPTLSELLSLYPYGMGPSNYKDPAFKTTGSFVWGESKDSESAYGVLFSLGVQGSFRRDVRGTDFRAFGVRSPAQKK